MNIVLLLREAFYEADKKLIPELEKIGKVKVLHTDNGIGKNQLKDEVKEAEIILVNIVKLDKEVMDAAPNLQCIIKFGAGIDNIDIDYAKQKGIRVTSAPGVNAPAVADHAFGLMLSAARRIPKKDSEVKNGVWHTEMGFEISGKTLGIIGFGAIGKELAKRATGFSMKTLVYGNHKDYVLAEQLNAHFVEKDILFNEADFIVVATSLTAKNKHLVNAGALGQMKPTAFLINISRGQLVDEKALAEALEKGGIAGAALDVFEQEPPENGLPQLENLVATPHIGGATYEAVARISKLSISNIRKLQKDEALDFEIE